MTVGLVEGPRRSADVLGPRPGGARELVWRGLVALVAGVAMAVAFGPGYGGVLAPLSVAAFVLAQTGTTRRGSALLGFGYGLAFMGVLLWWLTESIATAAWVGLSVAQAGWFALFALGLHQVRSLPGWPVWAAAVWTGVETLRASWPFGGFPWGRVGFAVVDSPWESLLPLVGVTGGGFVVVAVGMLLAWAALEGRRRRGRAVAIAVAGTAATLLPSAAPYAAPESGSAVVAVVQGGVPGAGNRVAANHRRVTGNHVEATVDLARRVRTGEVARPDLVVWPENSTAVDPFVDSEVNAGIRAASDAIGVPLLVGAMVDAPSASQVLNQGVVWLPNGPTASRYTKRHPVPFGEYVPFRRVLEPLFGRLEEVPRDMVSGTRSRPLLVGGVRVGDAICFDIAYDDVVIEQVRNGAQVLAVQTSNATFVGTGQLEQQFAITRARALETGRSIAVASTNGITGIVAADGSVEARAPVRDTAVLVERVSLRDEVPPAVRFGANLRLGIVLVAAGAVLVGAVTGRSRSAARRGARAAAQA